MADNKGLKHDKDTNQITHVSKLTRQTVEKMVNEAFEFCDTNKDGLLSQEQFTNWVRQNPGALQLLETVFAKHIWSGWNSDVNGSTSPKGMTHAVSMHSGDFTAALNELVDNKEEKAINITVDGANASTKLQRRGSLTTPSHLAALSSSSLPAPSGMSQGIDSM